MSRVIDTLGIFEKLTATNLDKVAAKAITEVIAEQLGERTPMVAFKEDMGREFAVAQADITNGIAAANSRLIKWVAVMLVAQTAVFLILLRIFFPIVK